MCSDSEIDFSSFHLHVISHLLCTVIPKYVSNLTLDCMVSSCFPLPTYSKVPAGCLEARWHITLRQMWHQNKICKAKEKNICINKISYLLWCTKLAYTVHIKPKVDFNKILNSFKIKLIRICQQSTKALIPLHSLWH